MDQHVIMALLALWLWAAPALGEEPKVDSEMIQAGANAIKSIKPQPSGTTRGTYFKLMRGPEEIVGYASAVIESEQREGAPPYRYTNEMGINFPNGTRIAASVSARLKPSFEPVDIETRRGQVDPDGSERSMSIRTLIGPKHVKLKVKYGDQENTQEVARPEDPFIYGIETLIQRIDLTQHSSFTLREFNPETGEAPALTVTVGKWRDGTPTVITRWPGGNGSYQFWFDAQFRLVRWGEASVPMLFVHTTKKEFDKIKTGFKPVKLPPSQMANAEARD